MRFEVEDMIDNIFGLDFLWLFTCKIDLINMKLIFREENNFFKRTYLMTIVNIEGKDVAVLIDTGYSGYVLGPLSLA